jgi:HEAT repeat protein
MDATIRASLDGLHGGDADAQNAAFTHLVEATRGPVDWAYEVWDEVVGLLRHESNRTRAIASQVLCALAQSDPDGRMVKDLDALLAVTRDERFVTARHCMQSLWKVGAAGEPQRRALVQGLERRFHECAAEKNCTLVRYDIVESLKKVYDATGDESVREKALELIAAEDDAKYRKKYAGVWKKSPAKPAT